MTPKDRLEVMEIVRQEIESIMQAGTIQKQAPPVPNAKIKGDHGRTVNPGRRHKFAATVDLELWKALEKYRKANGITFSRALDAALWNFLGKPRLSFEAPEGEEGQK